MQILFHDMLPSVLASGEKHMHSPETSQITSEVFVKPFTATQLEGVVASARDTLCNLGYQVNIRHDLSQAGASPLQSQHVVSHK